ncbi:RNA polymerase sigma factor [Kouleothrix sp.]|uniref:RNA polymerase sigma factor n=1 Tax=Kouleothrix sp. TaxID=2779161 RepID=UPI003919A167
MLALHALNDSCTPYTTCIELLYEEYQRPLLAYLTRLVSDREAAEDLCQETFIKALRNWHQRDASASVAAWLYRIATNTAYDFLRRRRRIRFTPLLDLEPPPSGSHSMESRLDEGEPVQRALAQLPAMYRLPLVMHSCEGHSTQEIAEAMGVSNSAIKTRLFRARERFREAYQNC